MTEDSLDYRQGTCTRSDVSIVVAVLVVLDYTSMFTEHSFGSTMLILGFMSSDDKVIYGTVMEMA